LLAWLSRYRMKTMFRHFNRVALAFTLAVMASTILIICASVFEIRSPDLFWHIRMGLDFINNGLSPFADHYSFTMPNAPIRDLAFLFQVFIGFLFKIFGLNGVSVYRLLAFGGGFVFLILILKRQAAPLVIQILCFALYVHLIIYRNEPRPEIFSFSLELLTIFILNLWSKERRYQLMAALALLLVFWTNFHLTSLFGFIIVGAFVIEQFVLTLQKKTFADLKFLGVFTALLMGVGFLDHDLTHPFIAQAHLSPLWEKYITEYDVRSFSQFDIVIKISVLLALLSIPALFRLRRCAGLVLISVLGFKLFAMYKLFPHFGVITLPWVAEAFHYYYENAKKKWAPLYCKGFAVLLVAIGLTVFSINIYYVFIKPIHPKNGGLDHNYYPLDTAAYMQQTGIKGRVINQYDLGGFLIFSNAPDISVYIDGRTSILYPIELYERFFEAQTHNEELLKETEKYDVHYLVARSELPGELLDTGLATRRFKIDYFGLSTALLTDRDAHFSETSKIFVQPQCFDEKQTQILEKERDMALKILNPITPLSQFLELLHIYTARSNTAELFRTPHLEWTSSSYVARLAAELARRNKQPLAQLFYLNSIKKPSASDRVARAALMCDLAKCANAENEIALATKLHLSDRELYIVWDLLKKISAVNALNEVSLKIRNKIESRIGALLQSDQPPRDTSCDHS
jgi:hypothetical protein